MNATTYGFGHSDFLLRNAAKIFGDDFLGYSPIYALEEEKNWMHGNFWFSIIPWIASDIGFVGASLFLGALSFIYVYAVRIYIKSRDPHSLLVSYLLFFLFLFFPANNFIVQSGEFFVATYAIMLTWLIKRISRWIGVRHGVDRPCSSITEA